MIPLFLAPMEGLGDRAFRRAMATVGGFDEATTEFMRVPKNAHCPSLARKYEKNELGSIPLAAQVMGYDLELVPRMCQELEKRGAPRIDLNCGCPSNTVTGRGAGSSLLRTPDHLHQLLRAICDAVDLPVTAKLRSGYEDTTLFDENILAAAESGIKWITLHPRTKKEGYRPPANWSLIARAKELVSIPVIGNGDINTPQDAARMLAETNCDGLMIGRGAVANPWLFHQVRAHLSGETFIAPPEGTEYFIATFFANLAEMKPRTQINKLKQISNFLLEESEAKKAILRLKQDEPKAFFEAVRNAVMDHHHRSIEEPPALFPVE